MFNFDKKTVLIDTREEAKKAVDILVEGEYLAEETKGEWPLVVAKSVGGFTSVGVVRRDANDQIIEEYERMETPEGDVDVADIKFEFGCERTKVYFEKHIEWHMNPTQEETDLDEEISDNLWEIYEHAIGNGINVSFLKKEGKLPIQLGNMRVEADFRSTFKDVVIFNQHNEEIHRIHDFMNLSVEALQNISQDMMKRQSQGLPLNADTLASVISTMQELGIQSGVITIVKQDPATGLIESVFQSLSKHTKNEVISTLMELGIEGDWSMIADQMIAEWTEKGIWSQAA